GSPFLFGYAKPVPVQFRNLRNPRRDSMLVAAAGPAANLLIALASAVLINAALTLPDQARDWTGSTLINAMSLNIALAVFNLIPIPPLDGSRVLLGLLPQPLAAVYGRLFRFGLLLVLGIIFILPLLGRNLGIDLDIIGWMMHHPVQYLWRILLPLTGLPQDSRCRPAISTRMRSRIRRRPPSLTPSSCSTSTAMRGRSTCC